MPSPKYQPQRGCQLVRRHRRTCFVQTEEGRTRPACLATLRRQGEIYQRRISAIHLSRPEHYLSIYQSGCNLDCKKCHSADFSQAATGEWLGADEIARLAAEYAAQVTVTEPRERATMYHAEGLCHGCAACVLGKNRPARCPGILGPEQVVLSPQGIGPARNIVAFTGGDVACAPEFYEQSARLIKREADSLWVLLETNGLGLDEKTLERLAAAGVDSLWLDIKAYHDDTHRRLTGASNETVLGVPECAVRYGMIVEVMALYIPGWVEADQIGEIGRLCAAVDPAIPFTVLAFFPAHRMSDVRGPRLEEMLEAGRRARETGCQNVRLGNKGVFCRTQEELLEAEQFDRPAGPA